MNHDIDLSASESYSHKIAISFGATFNRPQDRDLWLEDNTSNFLTFECKGDRVLIFHSKKVGRELILRYDTWSSLTRSLLGVALLWDACQNLSIFIDAKKKDVHTFSKVWYFYEYIMRENPMCDRIFNRATHTLRGTSQLIADISALGTEVLKDQDIRERMSNELMQEIHSTNRDILSYSESNGDIMFVRPKASTNVARIIGQIEFIDLIVRYATYTPIEQISLYDFKDWLNYQSKTRELNSWLLGFI